MPDNELAIQSEPLPGRNSIDRGNQSDYYRRILAAKMEEI